MAEQDLNQVVQNAVNQTPPPGTPQSTDTPPGGNQGGLPPSTPQNGPISQPGANAAPSGPPPEAAADIGHHYGLGKIVQSLFGNERSYSVDPKTGQTVAQDAPSKPGQIWRNIIAGVVLGGAAGQEKGGGTFLGGAVQGGKAEINDQRTQDAQKQANARKDFEQGLQARKANTEEQHASTQIDLMKAQIAMHNAQTLREMQNAQFEDFAHHDKMGEAGKARLDPFLKAGVPKVFDNIPETDIPKLLKDNPDATHLFWQPTGSTIVKGSDGNPQHVATMSAVDIRPGVKVKVTDDNIKAWKDAGLDKLYGNDIFQHLTKDKELDVQQYLTFTEKEQSINNDKTEKKKKKLTEDEEAAKISLTNAQAGHLRAETGKIYTEASDKKKADEAWKLFSSSGGDMSKMTPDQIKKLKPITDTLIKAADEGRKEFADQLRNDPGYGNTEQGKEQYKNMEMYHNALNKIMGLSSKLPAPTGKTEANENINNLSEVMDQENVPKGTVDTFKYINSKQGMSAADKAAAIKQFAIVPWSVVKDRAQQEGITRNKMATKMKAQGFNLEYNSDEEFNKELQDATTSQPM